jgi:two-component system, chemotaxis family, chemotaxis protein CheY
MFAPETHILVADDMAASRLVTIKTLQSLGYSRFSQATNGNEAFSVMQKAKQLGDPIHLVISDCMMPECTGVEFYQKMTAEPSLKGTPFILLTAECDDAFITLIANLDLWGYIIKPVNRISLSVLLESSNKK